MIEYIRYAGQVDGMDTRAITEMGEYFEKEARHYITGQLPFAGQIFQRYERGDPCGRVLKNEKKSNNIFDTTKLLGVRRS